MAIINLGNVVGMIKSETPPTKAYVLWGKILNPSFPDIVDLYRYSGSGSIAVEGNWDRLSDFWQENPAASGDIEYIGGMLNSRTENAGGGIVNDMETGFVNKGDVLNLGSYGTAIRSTQEDETIAQDIVAEIGTGYIGTYLTANMSVKNTVTNRAALLSMIRESVILEYLDDYVSPTLVNYMLLDGSGISIAYNDIDGGTPYPYKVGSYGTGNYAIQANDVNDVIVADAASKLGFFSSTGAAIQNVTGVVGGTAGGTYGATEQVLLQEAIDKLDTLIGALGSYNLINVI